MFKRLFIAAVCLASLSSVASAVEVPVQFEEFGLRSPDSVSLWRDYLDGMAPKEPRASNSDEQAVTLIWQKKIDGVTWTVSYLDALGYCSVNKCQVRVFKDSDLVLDTLTCRESSLYVLRPDADEIAGCNEPHKLAKIDQANR